MSRDPQTPIGVELYDSHTGDHVCYLDTFTTEHLDAVEFMYREGNYGCDCNRELFMARSYGLGRSTTAGPCGHDRYFVVRVVDRLTREELYEGDAHPLVYALGAEYEVKVRAPKCEHPRVLVDLRSGAETCQDCGLRVTD